MKYFLFALGALVIGGVGFFLSQRAPVGTTVSEGYSTQNTSSTQEKQVVSEQVSPSQSVTSPVHSKPMKATITTNQGVITIKLFGDQVPNTVANFAKLAGEKFYDGTKFHRVIENFMIQGGDPLTKDDAQMDRWGTGGPGYRFNDEIGANNRNDVGTISMANAGPNTNGSQFFINTANNNFLDTKHTVFGKVIEGMDVVMKISGTKTGPGDRPVSPMVIERITVK